MNIEEADPLAALVAAGPWIRHIQLSDSNRLEPGAGHIDWTALLDAIWSIGYAEELAYECRLSGPVDEVLPVVGAAGSARRRGRDRPAGRPIADGDRRAAAGRGARADRQLARALDGAVPRASTRTSGAGTRPSSRSACGTGRRAGRRPNCSACSGRSGADGRIPHIVFNPAVDPRRLLPGPDVLALGDRRRASAGRHLRDHPAPGARHRRARGDRRARARTARPSRAGRTRCLVAQNDYLRAAAQRRPGRAGRGGPPLGDRDGQLPGLGRPAARGAGRPVALRHLHPARPRARREGERPTDEDYARYIRLALAYRDHGYDDDWVRAEGGFLVVDPAFNALWAWSELALAELAAPDRADPAGRIWPRRTGSPSALVDAAVEPEPTGSSSPGTRDRASG